MLVYALWVPIIYHVFQRKQHYEFFFQLLKIFIALKAAAYCYEAVMILLGQRAITFEGFRFGVGYIVPRSEEHTSELQSRGHLVCRLLLEKKNQQVRKLTYK